MEGVAGHLAELIALRLPPQCDHRLIDMINFAIAVPYQTGNQSREDNTATAVNGDEHDPRTDRGTCGGSEGVIPDKCGIPPCMWSD